MSKRYEDALRKAKALLAKTRDNSNCTEAEKLAAYAMARAMIDAYEITEEDLRETKEEGAIFSEEPEDDRTDPHGIKWRLLGAIARWCGVEVYRKTHIQGLKFVGMRVDVEMAMWALEDLADQVFQRLIEHMIICLAPPRERRRITRDFVVGITERIHERLNEQIKQSTINRTSSAKALVIVKQSAIDTALKERGITLSPRDAAVLQRLQSGMRPGKNITWPVFIKSVVNDVPDPFAEGLSKRQLERVVDRLMRQHRLK
jgi:hypothetical protein